MSNSCPSLLKSPESDSRFDPQPNSAHCESATGQRQHSVKYLLGAKVRSRSLGQSARCLFGAWHHNIFTADCCFSGHSTKCASCGPPLRRASIGNGWGGESRSDALSLDDGLVNQRLCDPRPLSMNGRICSHSWTSLRHAHPPTHTHTPTLFPMELNLQWIHITHVGFYS